ncbi:hemoglobin/transferrin/lactoferrin receptor protein [Raoultella sp. BIGb0138]|uniref:TonB-dependent receptor domain-containing protein n=1 Tax=Raoultella sp. BIGb0138 TaxID=2485115 RepID=UPI001051037D|nr:TonB-dependent receptor [Raoultella sp. BIGb0138]TCW09976.1 hemoglobin/transferrin/lactoferrin receptor protein [Raoultella sp. BIGb0138]
MEKSQIVRGLMTGLLIMHGHAFAAENEGESVFSPLTITDNPLADNNPVGSSEESYTRPGAYSSRTLNKNLQSLDASLRSMAGTYTQIDPLQGAISVNIRGMNGLGRVNTMVDGVTQTYFGMAPANYHGGANTAAGVPLDPNFLAGVDVARGSSAGAQGVNALAGSANMRTIGIDDVLKEGRQTGLLSRFSVGDNGLGRTGMVAVAGKTGSFANGGGLGALVGISGSRTYATYKNGGGRSSEDFIAEDNKYLRQEPRSQLYKVNFNADQFNKLELSGRNYRNAFTRRDITSDDYYLRYHYAPLDERVEINLLASTSRGNQAYKPGSLYNFNNSSLTNKSNAFDISNTSRFKITDDLYSVFQLGGKWMDTRYTRRFIQNTRTDSNAFAPAGKQQISALYSTLTLSQDIYTLDLTLNYTRSLVEGFKPACADNEKCFPQGESTLHLDDRAVNPSATFSAQVTPWLQPFISWSRSSRAPNVQEVFFANEGGASMNPFLKPEKAQTWEAGFNINQQGLLFAQDSLHLKALTYRSRIKNYITSESFFLCSSGRLCQDIDDVSESFNANIYINTPSPVTSKGYEIEAGYDLGFAYANLSWSKQQTDQPTSIASTVYSFAYSDLSDLPSSYATLDIGGRLFDRKLTAGSLVKFTGKTKRLSTGGINNDTNTVPKESMPNIPTIVDLYSSWQMTDNILLRLSVQNVTNRDYAEALNRMNQSLDNAKEGTSINTTARGRTWVFGGEVQF